MKKHNNILSLKDYRINKVKEYYYDMVYDLEDYNLKSFISKHELNLVLDRFYKYYEKKDILYDYVNTMINHLNDIYNDLIEYRCNLDISFLIGEFELYELLCSNIKVSPKEEKVFIKRLTKELSLGGKYAE